MFSSNRSGAATVTSEHNSIWIWFPLSQTWFSWRHTSAALYLFMMVSRWLNIKTDILTDPKREGVIIICWWIVLLLLPGYKGSQCLLMSQFTAALSPSLSGSGDDQDVSELGPFTPRGLSGGSGAPGMRRRCPGGGPSDPPPHTWGWSSDVTWPL